MMSDFKKADVFNYAVIGNPINHSKSPYIHSQFAQQTQSKLNYVALLAEIENFENTVVSFFDNGGHGLNITVPFKERAWELVKVRSESARLAGAVNTIYLNKNNQLCGDNTDGTGLVRDLAENHGYEIADKNILLLGAGGAVRGVLNNLQNSKPASITIANRTVERAMELKEKLADTSGIEACKLDELGAKNFDLIINGTSAALQGNSLELPESILHPGSWCYDMMYAVEDTAFISWSKLHGVEKATDGIGMLVEQAAASFFIWQGVMPLTKPVIRSVKELMAKTV